MAEAIGIPESRIETPDSEAGSLLQARLKLLATVMFLVTAAALGLEAVTDFAAGHADRFLSPLYILNAFGTLLILVLWSVCRGRQRSPKLLYALEAGVLVSSAVVFCLAGRYLNVAVLSDIARDTPWRNTTAAPVVSALVQHYMSMGMALSLTQILVMRAAVVPSSARHTVGLMVAVGIPLLLISGAGLVPFAADRELRGLLLVKEPVVITVILSVWWGISTVVCAVISSVIYKLRREVRKAQQLGQYTLQAKLGEGGMGIVYRAHHALMRRPTAIKLLPPDRADPDAVARFEREVQLTAQLTHPNTITIFDYGRTPDGVFYYAMELLDGATVNDVVEADGPQPPERVIHVLRMIAGALSEAHGLGLIHRDIKPANIFLCDRGGEPDVAKVLDFGLVKSVKTTGDSALTHAGSITGTPLYMSPEALTAPDRVDARSDLYAVGAVGYFMITGHHVFEANTMLEVCSHHLHSKPIPPSQRSGAVVSEGLESILLQCLEKEPSRRPQSALELRDKLDSCPVAEPWTIARARAWWAERGPKLKVRNVPETIELGSTIAVSPQRTDSAAPRDARNGDTRPSG